MRRTRYKFIVNEGRRFDVLAYDADTAFRMLELRGYYNIERVRAARPHAPRSAQTWQIDWNAVREACDFLGVTLPVKIKVTTRQGSRQGAHSFRAQRGDFKRDPRFDTAEGGMYHHITVKGYLTPENAGRVLWHELTHAMQSERETRDAKTMRGAFDGWATCEARGKGTTYRAKPIEVEAREHECLNDDKPLAIRRPFA